MRANLHEKLIESEEKEKISKGYREKKRFERI